MLNSQIFLLLSPKETEYPNAVLKKCCRHGLILLPMKLSCEERKERMNAGNECEEAFLKCCIFATQLREKKRQEELRDSFGRSKHTHTFFIYIHIYAEAEAVQLALFTHLPALKVAFTRDILAC